MSYSHPVSYSMQIDMAFIELPAPRLRRYQIKDFLKLSFRSLWPLANIRLGLLKMSTVYGMCSDADSHPHQCDSDPWDTASGGFHPTYSACSELMTILSNVFINSVHNIVGYPGRPARIWSIYKGYKSTIIKLLDLVFHCLVWMGQDLGGIVAAISLSNH